jgi:hypothetical protein
VTVELHPCHPGPHAHGVVGVHAEDELAEGGVDQVGHGPRGPAVVGLPPSHHAVLRRHLHDDRVLLDRPPDAEPHAALVGEREGGGMGDDVDDLHGAAT